MKPKKAEMMSKQIITVIILIISFGIILLLYFSFGWKPAIDKDTCYESVVLRSSFNYGPFEVGKKTIPLKCKTEKICLSDRGDCDIEEDTKIRLSKDNEKAKEEVLDLISDKLYDCHSMIGEGMLNFMPHTFWNKNYCLVCSRIVFNEETRKGIEDVSYLELYKHMQKRQVSEGLSYLEAVYNVEKLEDMVPLLENVKEKINENTDNKVEDIKNIKINLGFENGNAIVVQSSPESTWGEWATAGGVALVVGGVVGTIVAAPFTGGSSLIGTVAIIGKATVIGGVVGGVSGGVTYAKTFPDSDDKYLYPTIYPYDIDVLQALKCTSFETAP